MIKVLFFASLRDAAGTDDFTTCADGIADVRDLVKKMLDELPSALGDALEGETVMVSVNQKYAGWDATLNDGDEVGLLPPVSGG
ncbi:molybdopterin synthase sulfur carrier subunit [Arenicella sp. 4NH20-0111]|uniref:MoaD/ThiS family protein n=1 Tax=Arenicella sp. 4NH20-0111 TaxID=3127648 RepID=UPI003107F50D